MKLRCRLRFHNQFIQSWEQKVCLFWLTKKKSSVAEELSLFFPKTTYCTFKCFHWLQSGIPAGSYGQTWSLEGACGAPVAIWGARSLLIANFFCTHVRFQQVARLKSTALLQGLEVAMIFFSFFDSHKKQKGKRKEKESDVNVNPPKISEWFLVLVAPFAPAGLCA